MIGSLNFSVVETLKRYSSSKASWYFINIPIDIAAQVRVVTAFSPKKWGSVPVTVVCQDTQWKTSLFPDKKTSTYLLFIKAEIRKKHTLKEGDEVKVSCKVA